MENGTILESVPELKLFGKQAVDGVWKYYDDKTGVEIDEGLRFSR